MRSAIFRRFVGLGIDTAGVPQVIYSNKYND